MSCNSFISSKNIKKKKESKNIKKKKNGRWMYHMFDIQRAE